MLVLDAKITGVRYKVYAQIRKQEMVAKKGFTLVEVLVTIVVATILGYAATLALNNMHLINERANDLVLANATAEGKLEALRNQGYNNLPTGTHDFTSDLPEELLAPRAATYTVTESEAGIKKIELTISYNTLNGQSEQTYASLIGEVGLGQ